MKYQVQPVLMVVVVPCTCGAGGCGVPAARYVQRMRVPVKSLDTDGVHERASVRSSAGCLCSAGIVGWRILALVQRGDCCTWCCCTRTASTCVVYIDEAKAPFVHRSKSKSLAVHVPTAT